MLRKFCSRYQLTIKILFLLLSVYLTTHLSAGSFISGSINAGGIARISNKTNAISIGNIDQRRFAASPKKQEATKQAKKKEEKLPSPPPGPDPTYKLREVYMFPNPAKHGKRPTVHVEAGIADSIQFRIYDISGALIRQAEVSAPPQVIDDGQGPEYAYEYTWNDNIPSGTYLCVIQARKHGKSDLKRTLKLAVIR